MVGIGIQDTKNIDVDGLKRFDGVPVAGRPYIRTRKDKEFVNNLSGKGMV